MRLSGRLGSDAGFELGSVRRLFLILQFGGFFSSTTRYICSRVQSSGDPMKRYPRSLRVRTARQVSVQ